MGISGKVKHYNELNNFNDYDEVELEYFSTVCLDIDECKVGTDLDDPADDDGKICPPNSDCFNSEGSYVCNCGEGSGF